MYATHPCAILLAALCSAAAPWAAAGTSEPIRALPELRAQDPARVVLGRALFNDRRLSRDGRQNCASCHQLAKGGADSVARSIGADGKANLFNTPTVYNSIYNFRPSWNGREFPPEHRFDHLIEGPALFANNWTTVSARLAQDPQLLAQFRDIYGSGPNAATVGDALQAFLRVLVTPSRFDRYLRGDAGAITADEKAGYARFKGFGCAACHQGRNVGGNMFQKFGAMRELPGLTGSGADLGRYQVTGREADRHVFRVPSLRNVALTAPYFHDGSVATLDEAVEVMFKYQLGRSATARDKELIVQFLRTLSGEQMPPPGALP
ncbi:MAG: cytochrome c peroxidase [Pseudomonadota bacterium]